MTRKGWLNQPFFIFVCFSFALRTGAGPRQWAAYRWMSRNEVCHRRSRQLDLVRNLQCQFQIRDGDHQHHGIDFRGLESHLHIKGPCLLGERVHQQAADANCVGGVRHAQAGIVQERSSHTLTMQGLVDCQSAQENDRDRIRHVAPKMSWSGIYRKSTRSEGVIRKYLVSQATDIGA